MRLILGALILCVGASLTPHPVRAQGETREVFSSIEPTALGLRAARLGVFDEVWQSVRDRYYDPALHGADWNAVRAALRPLAAQARTNDELYGVLRRMLRSLRDSHTRVYAPNEKFNWHRPRYLSTGLTIREVEGQLVIAAVEANSEAERSGARAGDTVVSVDGAPAVAVLKRLLAEEVSASRAATARFQAVSMLLDGPREKQVEVRLRNATGRERTIKLDRRERERQPALRLRRVKDNYWIADFNVFTTQIAVEFVRALRQELRAARGLIIDLRQNGGGEAEAMVEIISTLLPPGVKLGQFTDRAGHVFLDPQTRSALLFSAERLPRFGGPVIVLTSEKTASAAEILAYVLKERNRALILGGQTCGCVLGVSRARQLPDGGTLALSEMNYQTPAGARLEGVGVAPDVPLAPKLGDLIKRRDTALERALEEMRHTMKR